MTTVKQIRSEWKRLKTALDQLDGAGKNAEVRLQDRDDRIKAYTYLLQLDEVLVRMAQRRKGKS